MKIFKNKLSLGAFVLILSGLICKALGALFRLPLTNLLGIEGIGEFQLIMSLYSFALVVTCGGIASSLSKLIGSARAKGEYNKILSYLYRAIITGVLVGAFIGGMFFIFSKFICNLQSISNNKSYMLFVLLLPLGAILASLRGFFQGYENMLPTAISQILEQVFKFALGLFLAHMFIKQSLAYGVFGAFLGIVLSEVLSLLFLIAVFLIKNKKAYLNRELSQVKIARKEFDKANLLLTLSASILPLVNAFDGLIIVPRLKSAGITNAVQLFGLQSGVVGAILNFPLIISMAVVTSLLPNISYLFSRGSGGTKIIVRGLKMLLFFILPTTFGMVAISKEVFALFYKDLSLPMLDLSFELMLYGAFGIILSALMQYFVMLLQAGGNFKFILLVTALGGVCKAFITLILSGINSINIFALVLGNIFMTAFVSICALLKLKKQIFFSLKFSEVFCLLFSTLSMFLTVYSFVNASYFTPFVNILLAVILGVVVYLVFSFPFLFKIWKKSYKNQPEVFKS